MSLVRNRETGRILPCCWDDCEKPGNARIWAEVTDGEFTDADMVPPLMVGTPKTFRYIFCAERHRAYWENSQRDQGNLPAGLRAPLI
jgi:hypothetical protein